MSSDNLQKQRRKPLLALRVINRTRQLLCGSGIFVLLISQIFACQSQQPYSSEYFFEEGIVKWKDGDYQAATSNLSKAIAISPVDGKLYYFRGDARSELGEKQEALEDFTQAIRLGEKSSSWLIDSFYERGKIFAELGNYRKAIEDFNRAIKLSPGYSFVYISRGDARHKIGDKQGALADYRKGIELFPAWVDQGERNRVSKEIQKLQQQQSPQH
ncbi:tetratricopeptide repeat protein [Kovacikia minuta CCNUW1]|uniref:tetratricopeptide repeat protein n=1 Tax=Kovacikia minuta TaxID=2931930 RepID=UPI001CCFE3D3|nr:tetratricopeptide repeat protein [Kovacikia minuta]UBF29140.1 tetratricopeptide repeat protein [Kovacikia minuta CCNUW1]